ncbi:MAG: AraC family transcriptional regulator [Gammaproteobacteria bacterium]|nr:AraC family transcriptional regulator [Gammaproteobacteria bacterium]
MPDPNSLDFDPSGPSRGAAGAARGAPLGRTGEPGTVAICFVIAALASVRARGLDADALLARVGLASHLLDVPQARVSAAQYGELWRLVAVTLDDEFFGQDSRRMKSGSFAMLCHAVIHCRTLGQALERSLRFYRLILDDIHGVLVREGREARIELHVRPGAPQRVFAHETLLMLLYGVACWLVNRRITIQYAKFAYPQPVHSAEYRLMYSTVLRFGADCTAIGFDAAYLDLPVVQNERSLKEFLRSAPENIILKYKNATSVAARIRRRLRQLLPGDLPEFEVLARELHMTEATLRRRLHEEGTSYQAIKDDLRRDLALRYLAHTDRSVMDIALELGFSERSSFHRAFRKWTGGSPGEFRRRPVADFDGQFDRFGH